METDKMAMSEALSNMSPKEVERLMQLIDDETNRRNMKTETDYDFFGNDEKTANGASSKTTKDKRGVKVVAFRKQEEFGPKMRIKP
jgi:hypothetical protein